MLLLLVGNLRREEDVEWTAFGSIVLIAEDHWYLGRRIELMTFVVKINPSEFILTENRKDGWLVSNC